ncbi:MAG: hypothetical protein NZM31_08410 [Gemmatales bacterium]|nr:hypothetical protein [Gemmatales bacterium]MDW8387013.1 hypothetical protein [Gemmatales bacterium]
MMPRKTIARIATLLSFLLLAASSAAQDQPKPEAAGDLQPVENGKAFAHGPSVSRFIVPEGWEVLPPRAVGRTSYLIVRKGAKNPGDMTIDVMLSWSPLLVEMKDVIDGVARRVPVPNTDGQQQRETYGIEHDLLQMLYGKDKVGKPDAVTVNERPGFKVLLNSGPSLSDKEAGVVYIFETGPDERDRWKVKLRATFPKVYQDDALKIVDDLVKNLRW